jgi:hypothetical protein
VGFDGPLGRSDEDEQFASLTGCGLQTDEPPRSRVSQPRSESSLP